MQTRTSLARELDLSEHILARWEREGRIPAPSGPKRGKIGHGTYYTPKEEQAVRRVAAMAEAEHETYNRHSLARKLNLSTSTLIYWEKKEIVPKPSATSLGRGGKRYTPAEEAKVREVASKWRELKGLMGGEV